MKGRHERRGNCSVCGKEVRLIYPGVASMHKTDKVKCIGTYESCRNVKTVFVPAK